MAIAEPILQDNKDRFVIFPIKHHDIWEWYKKQEACIWTAEEIDLHQDLNDWNNKLNDDERYFINIFWPFLRLPTGLSMKTWPRTSSVKCNTPRLNFSTGSN